MMRRLIIGLPLVVLATSLQMGCRSTAAPEPASAWDIERAEVIEWSADHPSFEQHFALEASGLAASQGLLIVPSEKYGRMLIIDITGEARARTVRVGVPPHAELEGSAITANAMVLCDEAHAAVYEIQIGDLRKIFERGVESPLRARTLSLEGVDALGGKIGFEGIEVDRKDGTIYLLLERDGTESTGCVSRIWNLKRYGNSLRSIREPIEIGLEDCAWRLTGLAWWNGHLIALKTQYPGERYEVVTVDIATGGIEVVSDLTGLLRSLASRGWSNNVEGIEVGPDGSLWLVADNAVTGVIDNPLPPPGESRTLLLRIPPKRIDGIVPRKRTSHP